MYVCLRCVKFEDLAVEVCLCAETAAKEKGTVAENLEEGDGSNVSSGALDSGD